MNGFFEDLACGAIGYGLGRLHNSGESSQNKQSNNSNHYNWPIASVIEDWARHNGIYGQNNGFYRELLSAAEKYKDYFND